jgi:hypothetical protein
MALVVRAFPVRAGRAAVQSFSNDLNARADETRRFYTGYGVRRESLFLQDTKQGLYAIAVTDIEEPVPPKAEEYANTTDEFGQWFQSRVQDISGINLREQPLGPDTEQVYDSTNGAFRPDATLAVRMYPLTRGVGPLKEFAAELQKRQSESRAFYDSYRVDESWFVQDVGGQPYAIAVASMRGDIEGNLKRFAESKEPFEAWFKQRVIDLTGVDPNETPLGPPSEQVFEFRA